LIRKEDKMSFRTIGLPALVGILALGRPVTATPIASAFTSIAEPRVCGSVCIGPVTETNTGDIANGVVRSSVGGGLAFAQAFIDLSRGTAGVAVNNTIGTSKADASHTDTWFCASQPECAALAAGAFVPVTLNLHVAGNASLMSPGGFMDLVYTYDTFSLLGSSALGQFRFEFFEDAGVGLHADVEGRATFLDYHTGTEYHPTVIILSDGDPTTGLAFGADFTVNSFIGGCASTPCDLTQGIFTDIQGLSALLDPASNSSSQGFNSLDTFRVSITSGLPLVSSDGRTMDAVVVATPEPATLLLVGGGLIALGGRMRSRRAR
jgi:hypothetical protein